MAQQSIVQLGLFPEEACMCFGEHSSQKDPGAEQCGSYVAQEGLMLGASGFLSPLGVRGGSFHLPDLGASLCCLPAPPAATLPASCHS